MPDGSGGMTCCGPPPAVDPFTSAMGDTRWMFGDEAVGDWLSPSAPPPFSVFFV